MKKLILIGSGGHAKSVVDSVEKSGEFEIVGFLDIEEKQSFSYRNYKVIGTDDEIERLYKQGIQYAFITIGYMGKHTSRELLYNRLRQVHYQIPTIIDSSACIAKDVVIGEGTFIGKYAVVNADVQIGKMCIINTGAIVEHDCQIGDYTHIAVGAVLCGSVGIGIQTLVGANATILQERKIGNHVIIAAGEIAKINIKDNIIMKNKNLEPNIFGGVTKI